MTTTDDRRRVPVREPATGRLPGDRARRAAGERHQHRRSSGPTVGDSSSEITLTLGDRTTSTRTSATTPTASSATACGGTSTATASRTSVSPASTASRSPRPDPNGLVADHDSRPADGDYLFVDIPDGDWTVTVDRRCPGRLRPDLRRLRRSQTDATVDDDTRPPRTCCRTSASPAPRRSATAVARPRTATASRMPANPVSRTSTSNSRGSDRTACSTAPGGDDVVFVHGDRRQRRLHVRRPARR